MKFSRLLLGTVQFGLNYGIANTQGKPSFDRVKAILKTALDNGITSLDTAAAYGDSEEVLGKALAELGIADRMTVVSKVPPLPEKCDPLEFITTSVTNSLKRLRLPVIPLILFHNELDWRCHEELSSLIAKGMIEAAGVSLDSLECAATADESPFVQLPCNVFDHRFDDKIKNHTAGHIFIRSVYLQGLAVMPKEKIPFPELLTYREKLESFGMPMQELCMRYLLSFPGGVSVLTGVDTPEQLQENCRMAALGPLPADLLKQVSEAVPLLPERLIRPKLWNRN
ncbi:MAG: aldo/keto reductase [Lentisphaerae bacterium]|nr:aldo/keto reductase [Lentisphaerota bacterium]